MPIHVSYLAEEIDGAARGVRVIVPMEGTSQAQRGSLCALVDVAGASPEHCWVKFVDSKKTDFIIPDAQS